VKRRNCSNRPQYNVKAKLRIPSAGFYDRRRTGVADFLLFDLDGTLTDSGEGITKSVQYALEKMGRPEPDLEKLTVFVGPPLLEQFMDYCAFTKTEARKAVDYFRERYMRIGIFENRPYPGISETLAGIKQAGYTIGIASSKPQNAVDIVLNHFSLNLYFDTIVGSYPDGRRTDKQEVIEEALRQIGAFDRREQGFMVGDRKHDVEGARRAGLPCIAVLYGYGSREELEEARPAFFAESTLQLLELCRKLR
jgi:phosphoglycolate phosphatase